MAEQSVWYEQVDRALKDYIEDTVKVQDHRGVLLSVPTIIRKPDEDFTKESYPVVTFHSTGMYRDTVRYFPDPVVSFRDIPNNVLHAEKGAIPFTLSYQVDFWAKLQSQINEMTRVWLLKHPDFHFNLDVLDSSGVSRSCNVMLEKQIVRADQMSGKERLFRAIFALNIWVELDSREAEVVYMVTQDPVILKGESN